MVLRGNRRWYSNWCWGWGSPTPLTFLLIRRIIHIKDNANKYIDSKFAKLLFDANINKLSIAPIAMLFILGFIKFDCRFDLYIFIYTYPVIFIVLLVLTSETTLNALFKIQQFIISVNKCIDEVFNSYSNSNSNSNSNSLRYCNSNTTFRLNLSGRAQPLPKGRVRFYSTAAAPGPQNNQGGIYARENPYKLVQHL